jgi:hypothetical protein
MGKPNRKRRFRAIAQAILPVDYDPFAEDGPIQQARTQLASQPQPNAGFDQPPSAPQTAGSAPPLSPIVPNGRQAPSVPQPPGQDLHSQYQALRPMLGDRNAMLATVHPEVRQTLIAQAQALPGRQQPGQTSGPAPTSGGSGVTQQAQTLAQPAQPQPQTPPQQPAPAAGQPEAGAPAPNGVLGPLRDENRMVDSYVYKKLSTGTPPAGPQVTTANGSHTITATDGAKRTNFGGVYGHTLTVSEPGSNDLGIITPADPTGLLVATPAEGNPNFLSVREYKGY